jgi:hypothetical protein
VRGLAFFRQLPGWAKRLWYAILLITAVELTLLIVTLVWAPGWIWLTSEIFSLSAWPLGIGVLVVVAVGTFSRRWSAAPNPKPAAAPEQAPASEAPAARPGREGGYEIAAARGAARLLAEAARRPEGKAAVRRTARIVRAVRAAATPPEGEGETDRPRG